MQFIPNENTLLFNGRNSIANNNDLFVLNKQDDSISVLLEVNNSSFSDGVLNWKRYRNMIFLIVNAGPMQQGLWRTDGTPEGTTRIKRLNISEPGGPTGPEAQMTVSDNKLFFGASIQSYGLRLYSSQGTEATTQPFDVLQFPGILGEVAGKLILFGANTEYSDALFSLDVDQTTLTKNSLTINKIKIFPNPASSQIQISGLTDETGTVMLSDALGLKLGRWRFAAVGTLTIQLNDKYPSGLYFIVVETRNGIRTHKIFIK
jgi:ELWxxDGT repeat protein